MERDIKIKEEAFHQELTHSELSNDETKQQIDALARASASAHDTAVEQIDFVRRQQNALNQGTQSQVFMMPLGACIEQSTLIRLCRFELFKSATVATTLLT
ncbi:hypothetical protein PInf_002563 [Phytophthora infestans]|nr:hypothetical protein PInf_002563 [Phytophthora infestans]